VGGVGFIPLVGEVLFLVNGVEHPPLAVAGIDVAGHALDDFEQRDAEILLTAVGMSSQSGDQDRRRPVVDVVGKGQIAVPLST
jgi:hypothetical protein